MQLVVGAAIVRDGRVLAARRTTPTEAAGRWEFPGGKVEHGETPEEALVREVAEELGCEIEVSVWLPGEVPIGARHLLRVAVARLVTGEPAPVEHDQERWLDAKELDDVDWLEPDRPFLLPLRAVLARPTDRSEAVCPLGQPGAQLRAQRHDQLRLCEDSARRDRRADRS